VITQLRVKNYRGLRDVSVTLGDFHVLVGPNGSGKSTFLDVFAFLRDCLKSGLREAVRSRASSLDELTFRGTGGEIEIQVGLNLTAIAPHLPNLQSLYAIRIAPDSSLGVRVTLEELVIWPTNVSLQVYAQTTGRYRLVGKSDHGLDQYLREDVAPGPVGVFDLPPQSPTMFEFGSDNLALTNLPPDRTKFPTALAIRSFLATQISLLNFIPSAMAPPCPALEPDEFLPDGYNLARVAGRLLNPKANGHDFDTAKAKEDWIYHLRLALPDLTDISWAQRPDDRAEYLRLHYRDGLIIPSWALSEGTLRMLGLTLPAFLPPRAGIHLIEEPEKAVHPHALEVIVNALRAIPQSQVLVTTHSPLLVDLVGKQPLLIFGKQDGAVTITPGDQHPALSNWDRSPALSSVFSAGYLQ
jgi:predicted ATPase